MAEADVVKLWNTALGHLNSGSVTGKTDGSAQASRLNDRWDEFRQAFLEEYPFQPSLQLIDITAQETGGDPAENIYGNAYTLNPLYLRVRRLNPTAGCPGGHPFRILLNDAGTSRVLATDEATAIIEVVVDVVDEVQLLAPLARKAMAYFLAASVAPSFSKTQAEAQALERQGRGWALKAQKSDGVQIDRRERTFSRAPLVESRFEPFERSQPSFPFGQP